MDIKIEFYRLVAFLKQQPELTPYFTEQDYYDCVNATLGTSFKLPPPKVSYALPIPEVRAPAGSFRIWCPCGRGMAFKIETREYVCNRGHRISELSTHAQEF